MTKTLVAIHRIQRTVGKQKQAIPPGAVFDVEDDDDELTEGESPAAREALESDIALAKENGLKIEIRPRRIKSIREINAIKAARLQTDEDLAPAKTDGDEDPDKADKGKGKGKGNSKRDLTA